MPTPIGIGALSASRTLEPDPSPTPDRRSTPDPSSRYIYATPGFESGSIEAGMINSNGTVSAIAGSPFDEGVGQSDIIQIITDPRGRFVYVLNQAARSFGLPLGISGIVGFSIDQKTGALTAVPGSPVVLPTASGSVFPNSNTNRMVLGGAGAGHFLFQPNGMNGNPSAGFDVYAIDESTGTLSKTAANSNVAPVGSFTTASSDGRFVFNAGNGMAETFAIEQASGRLTLVSGPVSTSGSAGPMAVTAAGDFLYVANQKEGTVAVFAIGAAGSLTPVAGSPFSIDTGAGFLALTPNGKFLYVQTHPGPGNDTVKGYAVSPAEGSFQPIAGARVEKATTVAVDLSGKFAYISDVGDLFTYAIDPDTGALLQVAHTTGPSSDNEQDMVTAP
jgi:6-phosphogluconolactonase (cycloisomerase 2 family)